MNNQYIEQFNTVVASSTQYDSLGIVTGYTYKETIYPLHGLSILLFVFGLVVVIYKVTKK